VNEESPRLRTWEALADGIEVTTGRADRWTCFWE
jgi:hypothetical protein